LAHATWFGPAVFFCAREPATGIRGTTKSCVFSRSSTLYHAGRFYVRLIHVGPDGMKVDPLFDIDLNHIKTCPARGHHMLMNSENSLWRPWRSRNAKPRGSRKEELLCRKPNVFLSG